MSVTVDDTSSSISYSWGWELLEGSRTLHSTWDTDCQATFSFRGTHVAVYATVPRGWGETIVVDFAVDGGRSQRVYREASRQTINDDLWYEAGSLSSGDHTLTMTYYEGDKDFQLDRIVYTPVAASVNPPPVQVTTRATTIVQTQIHTQISTAVSVQTTVSQVVETVTPSSGLPSSIPGASDRTSTAISSISGGSSDSSSAANFLPPNSNHTVTATQFIKTSDEQTAVEPSGTGTVGTSSSASRTSVSTGAIVGAIIAALTGVIFLLLLVFLIRRRRRRIGSSRTYLDRQKALSNETASESGITPFGAHKEGSREALVSPQHPVTSRKKAPAHAQVAYGPASAESQAEVTDNSDTIVSPTPMPSPYDSTWNPTGGSPANEKSSVSFEVGHSSSYPSPSEASLLQVDLGYGFNSEAAPAYFPRGREREINSPKLNVDANVEARGSGGGDNVGPSRVSSVFLPSPVDDLPPAYYRKSRS